MEMLERISWRNEMSMQWVMDFFFINGILSVDYLEQELTNLYKEPLYKIELFSTDPDSLVNLLPKTEKYAQVKKQLSYNESKLYWHVKKQDDKDEDVYHDYMRGELSSNGRDIVYTPLWGNEEEGALIAINLMDHLGSKVARFNGIRLNYMQSDLPSLISVVTERISKDKAKQELLAERLQKSYEENFDITVDDFKRYFYPLDRSEERVEGETRKIAKMMVEQGLNYMPDPSPKVIPKPDKVTPWGQSKKGSDSEDFWEWFEEEQEMFPDLEYQSYKSTGTIFINPPQTGDWNESNTIRYMFAVLGLDEREIGYFPDEREHYWFLGYVDPENKVMIERGIPIRHSKWMFMADFKEMREAYHYDIQIEMDVKRVIEPLIWAGFRIVADHHGNFFRTPRFMATEYYIDENDALQSEPFEMIWDERQNMLHRNYIPFKGIHRKSIHQKETIVMLGCIMLAEADIATSLQ